MTRQWWAGDPERYRLAQQIERLAPGAVMVRVRPDDTVSVYQADYNEIHGRDAAHDRRIAELLRGYYGAVNWAVTHDFYPADGRLCAGPQPGRKGNRPAADGTFGSGFGPFYEPGVEVS